MSGRDGVRGGPWTPRTQEVVPENLPGSDESVEQPDQPSSVPNVRTGHLTNRYPPPHQWQTPVRPGGRTSGYQVDEEQFSLPLRRELVLSQTRDPSDSQLDRRQLGLQPAWLQGPGSNQNRGGLASSQNVSLLPPLRQGQIRSEARDHSYGHRRDRQHQSTRFSPPGGPAALQTGEQPGGRQRDRQQQPNRSGFPSQGPSRFQTLDHNRDQARDQSHSQQLQPAVDRAASSWIAADWIAVRDQQPLGQQLLDQQQRERDKQQTSVPRGCRLQRKAETQVSAQGLSPSQSLGAASDSQPSRFNRSGSPGSEDPFIYDQPGPWNAARRARTPDPTAAENNKQESCISGPPAPPRPSTRRANSRAETKVESSAETPTLNRGAEGRLSSGRKFSRKLNEAGTLISQGLGQIKEKLAKKRSRPGRVARSSPDSGYVDPTVSRHNFGQLRPALLRHPSFDVENFQEPTAHLAERSLLQPDPAVRQQPTAGREGLQVAPLLTASSIPVGYSFRPVQIRERDPNIPVAPNSPHQPPDPVPDQVDTEISDEAIGKPDTQSQGAHENHHGYPGSGHNPSPLRQETHPRRDLTQNLEQDPSCSTTSPENSPPQFQFYRGRPVAPSSHFQPQAFQTLRELPGWHRDYEGEDQLPPEAPPIVSHLEAFQNLFGRLPIVGELEPYSPEDGLHYFGYPGLTSLWRQPRTQGRTPPVLRREDATVGEEDIKESLTSVSPNLLTSNLVGLGIERRAEPANVGNTARHEVRSGFPATVHQGRTSTAANRVSIQANRDDIRYQQEPVSKDDEPGTLRRVGRFSQYPGGVRRRAEQILDHLPVAFDSPRVEVPGLVPRTRDPRPGVPGFVVPGTEVDDSVTPRAQVSDRSRYSSLYDAAVRKHLVTRITGSVHRRKRALTACQSATSESREDTEEADVVEPSPNQLEELRNLQLVTTITGTAHRRRRERPVVTAGEDTEEADVENVVEASSDQLQELQNLQPATRVTSAIHERERAVNDCESVGSVYSEYKEDFEEEVGVGDVTGSSQEFENIYRACVGRIETSSDEGQEEVISCPPIPRRSSRRVAPNSRQRNLQLQPTNSSTTGYSQRPLPVTPERNYVANRRAFFDNINREERFTPPELHPNLRPRPLDIKKGPPDPKLPKTAHHPAQMATLSVSSAMRSSTRTKAIEDARAMQQTVLESCKKAGRDPPKYILLELIGKGSFGRVYKGKDIISTAIVAVKIIDLDESDTANPRLANSYSEFMKEVNALKILSESKARNINHVIEALPVGKAMWMITEYCGGGSIATLMKPTPTGLKERFIVPILREVAEAVKWVHQAGIIHRDVKCANILITEGGGVQLCDFGVAGITETTLDKRTTFIGTFHWMAPEMFKGSSYGKEVDVWAFGAMAYEMATGLPPNAMSGVGGLDLGKVLKAHIPRLEGGSYSEALRSIVAFCLEESPTDRPTIEAVQRHSYIYNTSSKYPASSLSELVKAFKMWESHGGIRRSLFMAGGAQGPSSELSSTALAEDSWNFSTTAAFDQAVAEDTNEQDVINVYGSSVNLKDFDDETSRPSRQQIQPQLSRPTRRRPPPEALAPIKAPLEKIFDPNTLSNYEDNSRAHYNQAQNFAASVSDLPLRHDTDQTSIRDTLIDLDALDIPSTLSSFADMDTIRPGSRVVDDSDDYVRPALSDPVENLNRRTQDWKFPVMAPPASANPEVSRFPATYDVQRPHVTPAVGARPALVHHPTEPIGIPSQGSNSMAPSAPSSPNRMSLIDLDLSLPEISRPSTADSSVSQISSANPFDLERHTSLYNPPAREPSLYVPEDSNINDQSRPGTSLRDFSEFSDFSTSDTEVAGSYEQSNGHSFPTSDSETLYEESTYAQTSSSSSRYTSHHANPSNSSTSTTHSEMQSVSSQPSRFSYSMAHFPPLPPPPSVAALSGTATRAEMSIEMTRLLGGLTAQLEAFRDVYEENNER